MEVLGVVVYFATLTLHEAKANDKDGHPIRPPSFGIYFVPCQKKPSKETYKRPYCKPL